MSFTEKLQLSKTVYCYILEGKDMSGEDIFSYVAVLATKSPEFEKALKKSGFSPEEFGAKVVFAAKGKLTPEIRKYVEENYINAENVEKI